MTDLTQFWPVNSQSLFGAITAGRFTLNYFGHTRRIAGAIPVIWCHHNMATFPTTVPWPAIRDGQFSDGARSAAYGSYPVIADALGGESCGNDAAVLASGYMDDIIQWAHDNYGLRDDRVMLWADSLGGFNALNWAWRNPWRVHGIIMRVPATDMASLHARNPFGVAAVLEAAYGGLAGFNAALPTHDPMANLGLIRPFGDRIKIWAGDADTIAVTAEILAFAAQVGAEVQLVPGDHDAIFDVRSDETTMKIRQFIERKRTTIWDWSQPWTDLTETVVTANISGAPETWSKAIAIGPEGLRGRVTGLAAGFPGSNDRHVFTVPVFSAVDSELYNEMHSWNGYFGGQQGNFHRVHITGPYSGEAHVIWQNIFLGSPWILNFGVWVWDWSTASFDTNATGAVTPIAVRNNSGGAILASSRLGNVYTFLVDYSEFGHIPNVGDTIQTFDMVDATFNQVLIVDGATQDTVVAHPTSGSQPDDTYGGTGVFANHNNFVFPFNLRTRVTGPSPAACEWKAWPFGHEEPDWGEPDYSGTQTFEAGHHSGYGKAGFLIAHTNRQMPLDQGRFIATEL